jgi:hypothetical protein
MRSYSPSCSCIDEHAHSLRPPCRLRSVTASLNPSSRLKFHFRRSSTLSHHCRRCPRRSLPSHHCYYCHSRKRCPCTGVSRPRPPRRPACRSARLCRRVWATRSRPGRAARVPCRRRASKLCRRSRRLSGGRGGSRCGGTALASRKPPFLMWVGKSSVY